MLSVLTVERVGVNKELVDQTTCIEMFHCSSELKQSSPEGLSGQAQTTELAYLIGVFFAKHPTWTKVEFLKEEIAILRDSNDELWVAQATSYDYICFVES